MALFSTSVISKKLFNTLSNRNKLKTTSNGNYAKSKRGKISHPVLGKMPIQEKNNTINWIAESIENIADKILTWNESHLPPETTKSKLEVEILDKMTLKMVSGIP